MVADSEDVIGEQTLRLRGRIYWVFNELVIRDKGCRFLLELPAAATTYTEGKRAPATSDQKTVEPGTKALRTLLRYVNARVIPVGKGAVCLVCGRYRVSATVVGKLQPRVKKKSRKPSGGASAHNHSSPERRSSRHLLVEEVSNVSAIDLYGKLYSPDKYKLAPTD